MNVFCLAKLIETFLAKLSRMPGLTHTSEGAKRDKNPP